MPRKLNKEKSTLEKLYLKEKRGSYEIAKILNCSASSIRERLRKYKIPTRTIQQAKALTKPRYERKNFSNDPIEKAYLIGFRTGDLYATKTHPNSPTIRIGTNSTKSEQIELVKDLFKNYGHVSVAPLDKAGARHIRAFVNNSFSFLLKKQTEIESWILKNMKTFKAFLAGYTDAEGCFSICRDDGVFVIRTQDKNIVWTIYHELNKLHILCKPPIIGLPKGNIDKKGIKNNKDAWVLTLYRKDALLKLIENISPFLRHRKRIKDMKKVQENIRKRNRDYNFQKDRRWLKTYKPKKYEWA